MSSNYTNTLLDYLKDERNLQSDYQLAKYLGVGQSRISNYRNERAVMDWELAFSIGDDLKLDENVIITNMLEEKNLHPRLAAVIRKQLSNPS